MILHCGVHKTGSSYLQTLLASNRDILAAHSIHYPDYAHPDNRKFGPQHSIAALNYDDSKSFEANFGRVFALDSNCETLLISGEEFSRASSHPSFFEGLLDIAAEVTVVFYFRRFDHLLEGVYSEAVKEYLVGPISEAQYQLDFCETLKPFVAALGAHRIVVRPYNPKLWPGGSLGQDFCSAIGFPQIWTAMSKPTWRINESLSRPETYMLSVTETYSEKQRLLAHFRSVPFQNYDGSKFFRSPDFRSNFNQNHVDINVELAVLNGGMDVVEFLDLANFDDDPRWKPFDPSDTRIHDYLDNFKQGALMTDTLDAIGKRYSTDKCSDQNNFLNFYDLFLGPIREKPVRLLEIGVLNGGSVRTWRDYFPNGEVIGVDIDPRTKAHEQSRIRIKIADQSKAADLDLLASMGPFDVIIDDGSHVWPHQILTFQKLIGSVKPGGFFIIEDLDTSYGKYVPDYCGGAVESTAAYLQRLARLIVGQRVLNLNEEPDRFQLLLFSRIDFITFYRGAALLRLKGATPGAA